MMTVDLGASVRANPPRAPRLGCLAIALHFVLARSVLLARSSLAPDAARVVELMHGRYFARNKLLASTVPEPDFDKKFKLGRP